MDQTSNALRSADKAAQSMATSAPVLAAQDALLAAAVKGRLVAANVDTAGTVSVTARRGAVTLSGAVRSQRDIGALQDAAQRVPGVRAVRTDLHVDTHLPSAANATRDAGLQARVMASIAGQAGLNALRVHASAHAGVITLEGTVPSAGLKGTIVDAARGTAGVRRVVDRLNVHR